MRSTSMKRQWKALAVVAAIAAAGALGVMAPGARADQDAKTDLAGTWKIDRKASDQPGKYGGMGGQGGGGGMHEGHGGQGGHGGHGGYGGGGGGGGEMGGPPPEGDRAKGGRPGRLGPWLRIEANGSEVTVADSSGTLVREIVLGDNGKKEKNADDAAMVVSGKWKGSKLEVTAVDPRGREHEETWEVSDGGKTLTIVTKFDAHGDRPAMEVKRVYRRTSA